MALPCYFYVRNWCGFLPISEESLSIYQSSVLSHNFETCWSTFSIKCYLHIERVITGNWRYSIPHLKATWGAFDLVGFYKFINVIRCRHFRFCCEPRGKPKSILKISFFHHLKVKLIHLTLAQGWLAMHSAQLPSHVCKIHSTNCTSFTLLPKSITKSGSSNGAVLFWLLIIYSSDSKFHCTIYALDLQPQRDWTTDTKIARQTKYFRCIFSLHIKLALPPSSIPLAFFCSATAIKWKIHFQILKFVVFQIRKENVNIGT